MFFFGFEKASWLIDATPLATQLASWLPDAPTASRWYLERIIPGAPVFARVIPLGAMIGGVALAVGFWTRIAAAMSLACRVEPAAGRRVDVPVCLSHGRQRVAARGWLACGDDRGRDAQKGKTKTEERIVPGEISIRFSVFALRFQCTCLSQSFFPPEYTPNLFLARSIFQRR